MGAVHGFRCSWAYSTEGDTAGVQTDVTSENVSLVVALVSVVVWVVVGSAGGGRVETTTMMRRKKRMRHTRMMVTMLVKVKVFIRIMLNMMHMMKRHNPLCMAMITDKQ